MSEEWLLVKRDLYYRPGSLGYTGIRDNAGRFSYEEAVSTIGPEIRMVKLADAPEFTDACFDDLARNHLVKQRDDARGMHAEAFRLAIHWQKEAEKMRAALESAKGFLEDWAYPKTSLLARNEIHAINMVLNH